MNTTDKVWLIIVGDAIVGGGMDRANLALIERLVELKQTTEVVAHRCQLQDNQLAFHQVPRPANKHLLGAPLLNWAGQRRVISLRKRHKTVVVANGGNCRIDADLNWVHYVHAAYSPSNSEPRKPWRQVWDRLQLRWERAAFNQSKLLIANSEQTKQDLIQHLGVDASKIRVCYYGVDLDRFQPLSESDRMQVRQEWNLGDRPTAVFVGALGDHRKGFATLALAWRRLCQDPNWDAQLLVLGAGSTLSAWRDRADQESWGRSVQFLGFRPDPERIVGACDLLVSPARYEAYGLNVHEAVCLGLPAIVSARAGVAERFPRELNEWLLPDPWDDCDLAQRLRRWREDLGRSKSRFAPLREMFRSRSWRHCADDLISIMQDSR